MINGTKGRHASLLKATRDLEMVESIAVASHIEHTIEDPERRFMRDPVCRQRSTMVLDGAAFELAAGNKTGDTLKLTLEDVAVAALRRDDSFRKIAAGAMSRAQFIGDLIRRDRPWVKVHTTTGPKAKVELSRGKAKGSRGGKAEKEDTWDAAVRIMGEIGWRTFARRGEIWLVPDSYLLKQDPYRLKETTDGVLGVDFDFDVGKPAATATLTVLAGKTTLRAGAAVTLSDLGMADGRWLVEEIRRSAFTKQATVRLLRAQPRLPEPVDTSGDGTGDPGEDGWTPTNLTGSTALDDDVTDVRKGLGSTAIDNFVGIALAQKGKPYVWGASGPGSFDCSGLVQWAAKWAGWSGVHKPVTALLASCQHGGRILPVAQGINTRGALLMRVGRGATNHVAISLGDGRTIEAMGRAYGVTIGTTKGRFTTAGLLPQMIRHGGHPGGR